MQLNSKTMILIVAVCVAAGTAFMVKQRLSSMQPKQAGEAVITNRILVAKRDLNAGSFVNAASDIDWIEPKTELKDENVIREGTMRLGDFNGGVVRRAIKVGNPIYPEQITKAGDGGFLSAVLEPGMRAVAIAVNATTGAAGFIAPGDRVDLIVTMRMRTAQRDDSAVDEVVVSEAFVRDVRVVAIDQSLDSQNNKATLAKNVTVEVSLHQAEQITVASEMGKISMALRSSIQNGAPSKADDNNTKPSEERARLLSPQGSGITRVQAIRGTDREDIQFYNRND